MAEKTWKRVERKIAELIGGRRVPVTGRQRGDAPDIQHEWLSVECKHRQELPAWIMEAIDQAKASAAGTDKLPIAILHENRAGHSKDLVVMTLGDFRDWFGPALPLDKTGQAEAIAPPDAGSLAQFNEDAIRASIRAAGIG